MVIEIWQFKQRHAVKSHYSGSWASKGYSLHRLQSQLFLTAEVSLHHMHTHSYSYVT